jgi:hypothetical protein
MAHLVGGQSSDTLACIIRSAAEPRPKPDGLRAALHIPVLAHRHPVSVAALSNLSGPLYQPIFLRAWKRGLQWVISENMSTPALPESHVPAVFSHKFGPLIKSVFGKLRPAAITGHAPAIFLRRMDAGAALLGQILLKDFAQHAQQVSRQIGERARQADDDQTLLKRPVGERVRLRTPSGEQNWDIIRVVHENATFCRCSRLNFRNGLDVVVNVFRPELSFTHGLQSPGLSIADVQGNDRYFFLYASCTENCDVKSFGGNRPLLFLLAHDGQNRRGDPGRLGELFRLRGFCNRLVGRLLLNQVVFNSHHARSTFFWQGVCKNQIQSVGALMKCNFTKIGMIAVRF